MRTLKDGSVRYKPSAYKEVTRLDAEPQPMVVYKPGTKLSVYLASGWGTGYVRFSDTTKCSLWLAKENRLVTCTDNRNLMLPTEKS